MSSIGHDAEKYRETGVYLSRYATGWGLVSIRTFGPVLKLGIRLMSETKQLSTELLP